MAFNTNADDKKKDIQEFTNIDEAKIDAMVEKNIGVDILKYYDGLSHRRMCALTKPLRESMKKDTRIMTKDNPVFMY